MHAHNVCPINTSCVQLTQPAFNLPSQASRAACSARSSTEMVKMACEPPRWLCQLGPSRANLIRAMPTRPIQSQLDPCHANSAHLEPTWRYLTLGSQRRRAAKAPTKPLTRPPTNLPTAPFMKSPLKSAISTPDIADLRGHRGSSTCIPVDGHKTQLGHRGLSILTGGAAAAGLPRPAPAPHE